MQEKNQIRINNAFHKNITVVDSDDQPVVVITVDEIIEKRAITFYTMLVKMKGSNNHG